MKTGTLNLEQMFKDSAKEIRMWATWKLKSPVRPSRPSSNACLWDGMSTRDKDFNLVWNEIKGDCRDLSLPKLQKVMDFVRTL